MFTFRAAFASTLALVALASVAGAGEPVPGTPEEQLFRLCNQLRAASKLPPLVPNKRLMLAARRHALNMGNEDKSCDHPRYPLVLNGRGPRDRAAAENHRAKYLTENVIVINPERKGERLLWKEAAKRIADSWEKKSAQRTALLSEKYTQTGLAVISSDSGKWYFSQVFSGLTLGPDGTPLEGRSRHSEVPSLAQYTAKEKAYVKEVIRLMILGDLGKPVPNRATVRKAFQDLEPEAVSELVDAMNYVSNLGGTCPANLIAKQLSRFLHESSDLSMAIFMQKHLGERVTNPMPSAALKDIQAMANNRLTYLRKELAFALKRLDLPTLTKKASKAKGEEWQEAIREIGKRKGESRAFEYLVGEMEKVSTRAQRQALRAALVAWSGVDHGPDSDSPGEISNAVTNWMAWRRAKKQ